MAIDICWDPKDSWRIFVNCNAAKDHQGEI